MYLELNNNTILLNGGYKSNDNTIYNPLNK